MRLLPAAARAWVPWRNGGGLTSEVAIGPNGAGPDDFGWRISIARIDRDGPFSTFEGIDRTLMVLEGGPLVLGGQTLGAGAKLSFDGEAAMSARIETPALVLNVMTRRGGWRHRIGVPSQENLLLAPRAIRVGDMNLSPLDALLLDASEDVPEGDAILIGIGGH